MRLRPAILAACLALAFAARAAAQDPLLGRWEGTLEGPQGKRPAVLTLQRDTAANYSGTVTGLRGELPLSDIKVAGDGFTALAVVDAPQGKVTTKYSFTLQGGELRGRSETDFAGQTFSASYELKRAAAGASGAAASPPAAQAGGARRQSPPQPTQKQSLDYFAGRWGFRWVGRESGLTPGGVAEGTLVLEAVPGSPYLQGRLEGKAAKWSPLGDKPLLGFEESNKALVLLEQRGATQTLSLGDWSSPIAIRFKVAPFQIAGKRYRLNRTLSVVAAHSFTLVEELAEGDGPFVRLGNAIFSRPAETTDTPGKN
jgi:hypothetical protein